jgi:hypothetical protein
MPKGVPRTEPPPHGTIQRYSTVKWGKCRCPDCTAAMSAYVSARRAARKNEQREPPEHGMTGYESYGCRCETCAAAMREKSRAAGARRRARQRAQRYAGHCATCRCARDGDS